MTPRHRRMLVLGAAGVALTAAVVVLIDQSAHNLALVSRLRGATFAWLLVCGLGEIAAYFGFILSYQSMAQVAGGPRLPASVVVRVVGLSFGAFSVATAIGGLSVDFWALREAGEDPTQASARIIGLETMRWAVLAIATCVAAVLVLLGVGYPVVWVVPVGWLVLTTLCFAGGLFVSSPGRRERFMHRRSRLGRALGVAVGGLVYIGQMRRGPRPLRRRAIGGAALFWAGELLCAWAALRSFGAQVGIAALLLGYTTGYLATGLPLPLGGAGGVDAALTGGFVLAGAPLGSALLGAIAFRVFSFWLPALGALAAVLTAHGLPDRLREIARARRGPGVGRGQAGPAGPGHPPEPGPG